jgi:NADPH-dependent 2,4-dienoyl-CoA reductase/sulfur reductase-like enzyme
MTTSDKRQNVIIVGGGAAGASTARELSALLDPAKHRLILITARPHYTHLPGTIRMVVSSEEKLEERVFMPYVPDWLHGKGEVKVGRVESIEKSGEKGGRVVLADGETLDYSVLVLATGSTWEGPLNMPDSQEDELAAIKASRKQFEKANNIVLVGGGAIGIGERNTESLRALTNFRLEFAGEIKDLWPVSFRT